MISSFSKILAFLLCTTSLVLVAGCRAQAGAGPTLPDDDPFPYEMVADFGKARSDKLSGIVFYPPRGTLLAVSDNGWVIEIKTDGTFVQKKPVLKKADFEGITYNPAAGMLYVAVEGEETILEINPETLEAERNIPIDRMFEGEILLSPEGNGIEGITFVPAGDGARYGSFYLVNQSDELGGTDPSIVFEVEINHDAGEPQARIVRYFSVGVTDLSEIYYVPSNDHLIIISDDNDLLLEVSLTGEVLKAYPLPGKKQEGVTQDGDGFLYIAQDTKEALVKFTTPNMVLETGQ